MATSTTTAANATTSMTTMPSTVAQAQNPSGPGSHTAAFSQSHANPANGSAKETASPELKGWLFKWTNYIKGYQKRWFVLTNGLLSYYRSQGEMAYASRGTISLHGASIQIEDSSSFVVSNGAGTQTFHLRASSEKERQKWITALELAKAKGQRSMALEDDDVEASENEQPGEITKQELNTAIQTIGAKIEDLETCSNLISKHGTALVNALNALELDSIASSASNEERSAIKEKVKSINERSALLKLTSSAMVKAAIDFHKLCKHDGSKWQRILENEREIRQRFEDMVEQYAQQHSTLEATLCREYHLDDPSKSIDSSANIQTEINIPLSKKSGVSLTAESSSVAKSPVSNSEDDEEDFHDAVSDADEVFTISAPPWGHQGIPPRSQSDTLSKKSEGSTKEDEESDADDKDKNLNEIHIVKKKDATSPDLQRQDQGDGEQRVAPYRKTSLKQHRTRIPDKPNISISLWSIVKNSIGKDLTRIPVPVNFSEPLSMLQRLTEDYEYSDILDKAAMCTDDCEQMAYVAAFTVSSYSTTAIRSSKPFNPMLGETFEFDRTEERGFRCISEQVSHHPPMVAQYAESSNGLWKCWQEFSMRSKFKGKYLEVEPLGIAHLVFPKSNNHYTWRKVKTVVHNIVIGKLWVDQHGEMSVINHTKGIKCHMKFEPYSYFGGTPKKVTGSVVSAQEKVEWVLNGTWDKKIEGSKVINESVVKGKSTLEIGPTQVLWKVQPIDPGAEKYYSFTRFACELNEPEDDVAPTDSRLRPDQRLMEEGAWDEANQEKVRLEEKQRAVRRKREEEANQAAQEGRSYEGYQPIWFKKEVDEENGGKYIYMYQGKYWDAKKKQNWNDCPDIF